MNIGGYRINPALIVIDVQNGFVSKGGSYDTLGINILPYNEVKLKIRRLIDISRSANIPIFYTQAIREPSGIDLLTNTHKILPKAREERIRKNPICVRGTWDADIAEDLKPHNEDHIIIKRRESAFHDTEIEVWLKSIGVDTLIFCGIDTSISVESSPREAFNVGYNVILISDVTASNNKKHYESTIENVREYYGLVMSIDQFSKYLHQ